jgi:spore coat protein U domain-containing protein, fimbrial subunit CupE1/2/3/6
MGHQKAARVKALCAGGADVRGPRASASRRRSSSRSALCGALAIGLALWAGAAEAQSCRFGSVTPMVFTGYTPFGPGVAATSTITYRCPNPITRAWISISAPRTMTAGASTLVFELYQEPTHTNVWPAAPPLATPADRDNVVTVYGLLPPQDAAAGTYQRTLVVSVSTNTIGNVTDTVDLAVSASVMPSCIISPATLAYGSYDPLGAHAVAPLDAQTTFQIACTRGTGYTVGLGAGTYAAGATRQMANGAGRLQYELYTTAARTTVWSTATTVGGTAASTAPVSLTVHGRIPGGQAAAAGAYADTVQSTVNF